MIGLEVVRPFKLSLLSYLLCYYRFDRPFFYLLSSDAKFSGCVMHFFL